MKKTWFWAISLSHVRRKARVSTTDLGFFFYKFDLEKEKARRSSEGHKKSSTNSRNQRKPSKGLRKSWDAKRSSHVW